MLSDLWGSPPEHWRKNKLTDWATNDAHIFVEKSLPSQTYRRGFQYKPGFKLAEIRTGPDTSEHVPWASLREHLRGTAPKELRQHDMCVHVVSGDDGVRWEPTDVHVEVAPHETVGQLKARLADALGLPSARLRLIWHCVDMMDWKAVAASGPEHGSELLLVVYSGRSTSVNRAGLTAGGRASPRRPATSGTPRSRPRPRVSLAAGAAAGLAGTSGATAAFRTTQ